MNVNEEKAFIPEKIKEVELCSFVEKNEAGKFILKNKKYDVYLLLSEIDHYIWEKINGQNSIHDITLAVYKEYKRVISDYINSFIKKLCKKGFIANFEVDPKDFKPRQSVYEMRFRINKVEKFFSSVYNSIGKFFFKKPFFAFLTSFSVIGVILFFCVDSRPLQIKPSFFNLLTVYSLAIFPIILHEMAHAMACIHYGRNVKDAGFMLYMFIPVFYVNTTDIWMEPKSPRMIVSLAGIFSDLVMGAVFIFLSIFVTAGTAQDIFYNIALISYVRVLFNLNPLLKWDGYYLLMDFMEIPNLARRSGKFIREELIKKIKKRIPLTKYDCKLLIYGVLSFSYITYFIIILINSKLIKTIIVLVKFEKDSISFDLIFGLIIILLILSGLILRLTGTISNLIKNKKRTSS